MKSIQNTLGAMAIFAGILAGSAFAEETQTTKSTTQTAAATAVGNTANNAGKTKPLDVDNDLPMWNVQKLKFKNKADIKTLTDEATSTAFHLIL